MRSDIRKIAYISRRALALLLTLVMVLAIVPPIDIFAATQDPSSMQIVFDATEANKNSADTYYHRPIVINETTMADFETYNNRYRILIKGEPFSVTVQGLTNVDITFDNVTIDRTETGTSYTIGAENASAFWDASVTLGWIKDNGRHYVPTCPFWILDSAEVVASFIGNNVFKAGSNMWYIERETSANIIRPGRTGNNVRNYYHGYAGIQIEGGSSLTIQSGNVEAWGAHQMTDITSVEDAKKKYITTFGQNTPNQPPEISTQDWPGNDAAGGAGIGGGTYYNYNTDLDTAGGKTYSHATPGNLTINGGNVTAIGGFKSAGIGGGVNGALSSNGGVITINGDPATSAANKTKVTAIGSYYAAGIGEGDSTPSGAASDSFRGSYSLIINGGEVYSQGGFKAAGIGTTDELSNNSGNSLRINSGLTITLNGGDITALSGEADIANNPNPATAAIGAGEGTNMAPYSISIAEGTIVKAVSFSKYAISNIGTDADQAPQNIIDPNTYMYLAYYDRDGDVGSDDEDGREFDLYQIKRTDRGDFMLVVDHTELVLGHTTHDFVYLGYNEEKDRLYVVDQNGKTISDSKKQVEIFYIEYDPTQTSPYSAKGTGANGQEVNLNEIVGQEDLTDKISKLKQDDNVSYYFTAPPMKTFTVPAGYTAVAMTLYHPDDFGGRYIFHIPLDEKNGKKQDVYAIIEKMASGDSSGKVEAVFDSHFTMANPLKPGSPAITPDKISTTLTNLVVTSDTSLNLALNDAEQTFAPGTKSYTIWLPANTEKFNVTPMWATNVSGIVTTIREGTGTNEEINNGQTWTFGIDANETKVIWIEKKDPGASAVVYRLSVRVKPNYEIIMNDPDKVYDGLAASVSYSKMNSIAPTETIYTVTSPTIGALGNNWTPAGSETPTTITFSGTVNDVQYRNNSRTSVNYSCTATYSKADNKLTVTTTITGVNNGTISSVIDHVTEFTYNNDGWSNPSTKTAGSATARLNNSNYTFNISWNQKNLQVQVPNRTASPLFNYSTQKTETTSDNSAIAVVQAAQAARKELEGKDESVTSASAEHEYTATRTVNSTLQLGTASVSVSDFSTQTGTVTVTVTRLTQTKDTSGAVDVTNQLANQKISYSYTQTHDAYGNELAPAVKLDAAPSAAGTYTVTATVNATEFQASGSTSFTISQRPITLIGVENWRYYLNNESPDIIELTTDPNDNTRFYAGAIRMDGVIQDAYGEYDVVEPTYTAMFFKDKEVGALESDKIHIYATLEDSNDNDNANYTFVNYDKAAHRHDEYVGGVHQTSGTYIGSYFFAVPGQITYEVDGAMFLYGDLTSGDDMTDFLWYKYYPVLNNPNDPEQLGKYLVFKDEDGKPGWDDPVDYHSPDNQSHAEYIYVRTVNEGEDEARYAVDITFGDMVFYYTKTIWNVNDLVYEKVNQSEETENPENPENGEEEEEEDTTPLVSQWVAPTVSGTVHGIDLTSGDILIENRSNEPIFFTARTEIDIHCVMVSYNSGMQFEDDTLNEQHRIAARMIWGDKNTWTVEELQEKNNSVNTGNTGVATTQKIEIPAAKNVGINATEAELDTAPGYKIVSIRLFGIPTGTETVGSVTISLVPTN